MSEESQVFRGDRTPERANVDGDAIKKKPAPESRPLADAASAPPPTVPQPAVLERPAAETVAPAQAAPVVAVPACEARRPKVRTLLTERTTARAGVPN